MQTAKKLVKATVKMGRMIPVKNQEPRKRSKAAYISVWVDEWDGSGRQCLLLTDTQVDIARRRAANNPEDCPRIGRVMTLFRKGI
jgi:hypothetical protein